MAVVPGADAPVVLNFTVDVNDVVEAVSPLLAVRKVKVPATGVALPMAAIGLSSKIWKPAPVTLDDAVSVVNAPLPVEVAPMLVKFPATGETLPMGAVGLSRKAWNPAPDIVDEAESVVKAPEPADVAPMLVKFPAFVLVVPIAPGEAQVAPIR